MQLDWKTTRETGLSVAGLGHSVITFAIRLNLVVEIVGGGGCGSAVMDCPCEENNTGPVTA